MNCAIDCILGNIIIVWCTVCLFIGNFSGIIKFHKVTFTTLNFNHYGYFAKVCSLNKAFYIGKVIPIATFFAGSFTQSIVNLRVDTLGFCIILDSMKLSFAPIFYLFLNAFILDCLHIISFLS